MALQSLYANDRNGKKEQQMKIQKFDQSNIEKKQKIDESTARDPGKPENCAAQAVQPALRGLQPPVRGAIAPSEGAIRPRKGCYSTL